MRVHVCHMYTMSTLLALCMALPLPARTPQRTGDSTQGPGGCLQHYQKHTKASLCASDNALEKPRKAMSLPTKKTQKPKKHGHTQMFVYNSRKA